MWHGSSECRPVFSSYAGHQLCPRLGLLKDTSVTGSISSKLPMFPETLQAVLADLEFSICEISALIALGQ